MKKIILFLLLSMFALAAKDNCFKLQPECKGSYQNKYSSAKCYLQDKYSNKNGYVQDKYPAKKGYVKDKSLFGFSNN